MHARNECLVESATESKPRLNETLSDAKCSYQVSEARQSAQRGKSYKSYLYKVGERLWINNTLCKGAYSKSPQSHKLSAKQFGPCFVKKLVGKNAVKVELPSHFKIHDFVHFGHTTPNNEQFQTFTHL